MRKALYILGDLNDRDIIWLSRHGEVRQLAAGDTLIAAGRDVSQLYFVTDGAFTVTNAAGQRIAGLALGDVIGEMSFVEHRTPNTSVIADGDARVLAVPRAAILAEFAQDAGFAARFYRALAVFLSDRLRTATAPDHETGSEIDESILDQVSNAGDRFIRLLDLLEKRLA